MRSILLPHKSVLCRSGRHGEQDAGEAHLSAALREPQIASLSVEGVNARAEHDADSFIDALHDDKVAPLWIQIKHGRTCQFGTIFDGWFRFRCALSIQGTSITLQVVGASLKDLHFDIDLAIRQGKDPVAEYLESKRKVHLETVHSSGVCVLNRPTSLVPIFIL